MIQYFMNGGEDNRSGTIFRGILEERGIKIGPEGDAIVNYGAYVADKDDLPTLNRKVGTFDKLRALRMMQEAGVSVPPFCEGMSQDEQMYPCLGRRLKHSKGRDIVWLGHPGDYEVPLHAEAGHVDYSIKYIPKAAEYRVWAWRGEPLATYKKVLHNPEDVEGRTGSKWYGAFGYEYEEREMPDVERCSVAAVSSLGLDFGAVDTIVSVGGIAYVLEVNTDPWQSARPRLRGGLRLARKIEEWVKGGYPER